MPRYSGQRPDYFNVSYGVASVAVSVTSVAISTTEAAYHGMAVVAGASSTAKITLYDAVSTTAGNIVDIIQISAGQSMWIDRYIPVIAKNGIYMVATGTGITGSIFIGPKG